jgi:hypothetical protein
MSTLKTNNVQVGQSVTATNNFTLYQPATPDGTVRLGVGNSGATTLDVITATSAGAVTLAGALSGTTGSFSGNLSFNSGYGSAAVAYGCRAWVNFNGTGTVAIRASGNVTSITDNGVGEYTANFTTALTDTNYAIVGIGGANEDGILMSDTRATTSIRLRFYNNGNSSVKDNSVISVAIFR